MKRMPVIAAALAVSAVLHGSCGSGAPGAAAVVGPDRISERELADAVGEVLRAGGRPENTANADLTRTILDRMVKVALVDQAATRAGVVVTQGEIDRVMADYQQQAGGAAQFDGVLLGQGIAPSQADVAVKLNIQAQKLAEAIAPGADPQSAGMELVNALGQYSIMIGTEISPRYGTWDISNLSIGGQPSDLSIRIG